MMYVGWQHNSQGEFYDETGIHWGYLLLIGLSWFAFITVVPLRDCHRHFPLATFWSVASSACHANDLTRRCSEPRAALRSHFP